jgi:hypothetical protein
MSAFGLCWLVTSDCRVPLWWACPERPARLALSCSGLA